MKNNFYKRLAAIFLLIFFVSLLVLTIFFGLKGNSNAAISLLVFNGFFTVVVYFLLQFTRLLQSNNETFDNHNVSDIPDSTNTDSSNKNSVR